MKRRIIHFVWSWSAIRDWKIWKFCRGCFSHFYTALPNVSWYRGICEAVVCSQCCLVIIELPSNAALSCIHGLANDTLHKRSEFNNKTNSWQQGAIFVGKYNGNCIAAILINRLAVWSNKLRIVCISFKGVLRDTISSCTIPVLYIKKHIYCKTPEIPFLIDSYIAGIKCL